MSWFTLMEMALIAIMTIYLTYHTHLFFRSVKKAKLITFLIIVILIFLCQINMNIFGFLVNACFCFIIFDIINLILFKTKLNRYFKLIYRRGMVALVISIILSGYGIYNAKNTIVTTYDVEINKDFKDKRLMVVSDVHLGTAINKSDLNKINDEANEINPDAIILLGDIYDEETSKEEFDYSLEFFSKLADDFFVYYIVGNHEIGFQGGNPLKEFDIVDNLEKVGVQVLLDQVIQFEDIYLIGRQDYSVKSRVSLESLVSDLDKNKPLILLDHQPHEYCISKEQGIDLELSGHTHAGQIFPLEYFYDLINVNDLNYGIETDGDFNAIVTSGMGTWGYAMRTSRHSEILVVNLIAN